MRLIADRARRHRRDERGMAMVTAVGVMFIVAIVAATSAEVAQHSVSTSARGRDRVAALHAAEAGVNRALEQLATVDGADYCGEEPGDATTLPGAADSSSAQQYRVEVSDSLGVLGTCNPADPVRLVRATGYSPSASAPSPVTRVMEAQVRLTARYATVSGGFGFDDALFSSSPTRAMNIANSVTALGSGGGNNADVYSNHDIALVNIDDIHGDVVSQGDITLGNRVRVRGNVLATGDVVLSNNVLVDGSVTSATGSVTLNNSARVVGDVRAATTISLNHPQVQIDGTQYPSSPSTPPPVRWLPTFSFDAADPAWPQPVVTHATCATFLTYLVTNAASFTGTHRVTSDCETLMSTTLAVTVTGRAAVVTDGTIRLINRAKFVGGGAGSELWLISLHEATSPTDTTGVQFRNSSTVESMPVFIYTRNQATKGNSVELLGQIYAERVSVENAFQLTFHPLAPVGFTAYWPEGEPPQVLAGFDPRLLFLREVN